MIVRGTLNGTRTCTTRLTLAVAREKAAIVRRILALSGRERSDLQRYLGSPHPVLGLSVPHLRGIVRAFRKAHPGLTAPEVNAVAAAVWRGRTFDEKAVAIALMYAHASALDESSWNLLDTWVDECVGWGMCDGIGSGPIAEMVRSKPARFHHLMKWAASPNLWRRRIALYALHDFVLAKDLDKPFQLILKLLYDQESWVQRAVGTWLRECWKRDRRRTESFLRNHVKGLPKVVITVSTERAPKAFREELRRNRENLAKKI